MDYVYGKIYERGRFRPGYIGFEDGIIISRGERVTGKIRSSAIASGMVIPTFYNSHIHLADSFLFGQFSDSSVNKLVDPRTGIKMKKLKAAPDRVMIDSTREMLKFMCDSGTSGFIDFREMGIRGLKNLKRAMKGQVLDCLSMGRPYGVNANEAELTEILKMADGLGVSAYSDWPKPALRKVAKAAHSRTKLFALHVSETKREDIRKILELEPEFIIHMIEATRNDLRLVADSKTPVVVCPRSNMFYGNYPDITEMVKSGIKVLLGTDNAMLTPPDMLRELEFSFKCAKMKGGITPRELMEIAFHNPRILFEPETKPNAKHFETGSKANFIVLDIPKLNSFAHPENLLCLGISRAQIELISIKNHIWRRLK
jgi:cytosine/adenosine deaminase-related metal-dependent hydrolase